MWAGRGASLIEMEVGTVSADGAAGGGGAGTAPAFVEFSREEARGRREEPMFTLQASGMLSFNQAAFSALGEPVAVALLYDAEKGIVGVRKVRKDHPNAYPVRRQGKSQTYLVSAQGFTAYYEIPTVAARRFPARDYNGGIWGFALREGDAVKNRRGARDEPAITGRWRHTTSGFDVPAMMNMASMVMPVAPGVSIRPDHERPPTMRIGTVVACAPLGSTPSTSELRSRFLGFLGTSPVGDLVTELSQMPKGRGWQPLAGRGRINLEAEMVGGSQAEPPVATAFLLLPDPALTSYGRDSRYAQLVVEIELRDADGRPMPAMTLPVLHDRFTRALAIPGALADFLAQGLGLATSDDPSAQVGVVLRTPRAMVEVVDWGDLKVLPGSQQSNMFMGWAIADPAGQSAAVTAVELLRNMCDYTLNLDQYEPALEALSV
jgi:hypothetical protein